jgi:hypothetical protein
LHTEFAAKILDESDCWRLVENATEVVHQVDVVKASAPHLAN